MNELMAIDERYGIPVIEDAAGVVGFLYHVKRAGSIGKFGTFSFHGTKILTTGEGGIFVTNDPDLYESWTCTWTDQAVLGSSGQFLADVVGFKLWKMILRFYKMSQHYHSLSTFGINWQDTTVDILWPICGDEVIVRNKDASLPFLEQLV